MIGKVICRTDHAWVLRMLAHEMRRRGIDIPGAREGLDAAAAEIERLRGRVEELDPSPFRTPDA